MTLTLPLMSSLDTASECSRGQQHSVTREFRRNSVGSAGIFPKAPTMGHHSTIHKRPQSSHDTQTSALDQTPHVKNAIPYLTAKDTSLQLYPIKDLPSPQQPRERFKSVGGFKDHTTGEVHFRAQEDYTSTQSEHPQSPYDIPASALNQTPHKQNVIPNLTAKDTSLQLYPIKDLPSPQQLREEFKWYPPFQDHTKEEEDKFYFQSQEGHPRMIPKHPESSCDAQASALNETPHEKNAIPNLTVRDASSLPYPIKDLPSLPQLLEQEEAKWDQRFQELQGKFLLQILECQAELYRCSHEWLARFDKKDQEIREKSNENAALIVESSPPICLLFSN